MFSYQNISMFPYEYFIHNLLKKISRTSQVLSVKCNSVISFFEPTDNMYFPCKVNVSRIGIDTTLRSNKNQNPY
jgi:hypothetical protein